MADPTTKAMPLTDEARANVMENALRRICTAGSLVPGDPFDEAYRKAGGGYEGLQGIAVKGLELAEVNQLTFGPSAGTR